MRVLVACHPTIGHIGQFGVAVRALVAAGHAVTWYSTEAQRSATEAAGATLLPMHPNACPATAPRLLHDWIREFHRVSSAQYWETLLPVAEHDVVLLDPTVMGVYRAAEFKGIAKTTTATVLLNCVPCFSDPRLFTRALQATVSGFEYPGIPCIGPLLPPRWQDEMAVDDDDERPLVFCTQGTLANEDPALIRAFLDALSELPKYRGLVVCPTKTELWVPPNVTVQPFVDYHQACEQAALVVTNGGYTGVNMALAYGRAIIAAGETEDKVRVGELVEWSGVGINLRTACPHPAQLIDAIRTWEHTPRFRERAQEFRTRIMLHGNPAQTVVRVVEEVGGLQAKQLCKERREYEKSLPANSS